MKACNVLRFVPIFLLVLLLGDYSANAHISHLVNDVHNELRNSFRNFFRSINGGSKPRWYHEHHRPEPVLRPFGNRDRAVIELEFLPEPEATQPATTIGTTSTTTTATSVPERPRMPERRRLDVPAFPNRDRDSRRTEISEFSDKPGYCPLTPKGPWICSSRCSLDTDCRGEKKCCSNRCGAMACVTPEKQVEEFDDAFIR